MKYPYTVKSGGTFYPPGTDVPDTPDNSGTPDNVPDTPDNSGKRGAKKEEKPTGE